MSTSTPWGMSQTQHKFARGINFYSTASHGGIKVSEKLNKQIPEIFRSPDGWYEEDCQMAIVAIFFPQYFKPESYLQAIKTMEMYYAEEWLNYKLGNYKPVEAP